MVSSASHKQLQSLKSRRADSPALRASARVNRRPLQPHCSTPARLDQRRHSSHSKDSPMSLPSGGGSGSTATTSSKKDWGSKALSACDNPPLSYLTAQDLAHSNGQRHARKKVPSHVPHRSCEPAAATCRAALFATHGAYPHFCGCDEIIWECQPAAADHSQAVS